MPETVLLERVRHRSVIRWERHRWRLGPWAATVTVGQLGDTRWYVDVVSARTDGRARVYASEAHARHVAGEWMRTIDDSDDAWRQVPCDPTFGWHDDEQAQPSTGSQE